MTLDNNQLADIATHFAKVKGSHKRVPPDVRMSLLDIPTLIKEIYALQDQLAECEAALKDTGNLVLDFTT